MGARSTVIKELLATNYGIVGWRAAPWPGLLPDGSIRVKAAVPASGSYGTAALERANNLQAALLHAQFLCYAIGIDAANRAAGKAAGVKPPVMTGGRYAFMVRNGLIGSARFDPAGGCEIVYRVPLASMKDLSGRRMDVTAAKIPGLAYRGSAGKYSFDKSSWMSRWADDETLEVRAFGSPGEEDLEKGRRRLSAKSAALHAAEAMVIEILKGKTVEVDVSEREGALYLDAQTHLEDTVRSLRAPAAIAYDEDDNCEILYRRSGADLKKKAGVPLR
ncbi:MAG: hypothetical protein JW838_05540 [Spirochaetes bacterium]|nr:hypothetical protein [Spirochaetota bacterium]